MGIRIKLYAELGMPIDGVDSQMPLEHIAARHGGATPSRQLESKYDVSNVSLSGHPAFALNPTVFVGNYKGNRGFAHLISCINLFEGIDNAFNGPKN